MSVNRIRPASPWDAQLLLAVVTLPAFIYERPAQSGGVMQRLAIVRALAYRPVLLLADEPTGNLNSENSAHVVDLLRYLAKQHLVLVATHNEALARTANSILSLRDEILVQAP